MNIEKHFQKETITKNIAKYELYYQISLGRLCSNTNKKVDDENIELQYALGSIYELLKDISTLDNFDEIFEDELRKQSAMDALQHFANSHLESVKSETIEIETTVNDINDNKFFNSAMIEIYEKNRKNQIQKWSSIITDDLSDAILSSLKQLENSN
ncbi:MAG: hypothetical protein ACQERD_06805 [Campylobacterota bacterium]